VGSSVVAQAEAAAEEALRNATWLDVSTVLPPSLTAADVSQLLEHCCSPLVKDAEHKQGQVSHQFGKTSLLGGQNLSRREAVINGTSGQCS
jgi:hypothetical protein